MYIVLSLVFLTSFFTGLFLILSDGNEKNSIKEENDLNISKVKQSYAIIDNEII